MAQSRFYFKEAILDAEKKLSLADLMGEMNLDGCRYLIIVILFVQLSFVVNNIFTFTYIHSFKTGSITVSSISIFWFCFETFLVFHPL